MVSDVWLELEDWLELDDWLELELGGLVGDSLDSRNWYSPMGVLILSRYAFTVLSEAMSVFQAPLQKCSNSPRTSELPVERRIS